MTDTKLPATDVADATEEASLGQPSQDDLRLMAIAIAAMKASRVTLGGPKPPIYVGAAIRMPDGSERHASRSELREGEHAEYRLIDGRLMHEHLDHAVLYTTLEPCAPGSRTHPRMPCAERIVAARIKSVWVGIADPYPSVASKGLRYLQENGVRIGHFPVELQDRIRTTNTDFLAYAAREAERLDREATSEDWILQRVPRTRLRDLSVAALEFYRGNSRLVDSAGSPEFRSRLYSIGAITDETDNAGLTRLGVLLFAEEPRRFLPQAGIRAVVHGPDGTEVAVFDRDLPTMLVWQELRTFLRRNVRGFFQDRGGSVRRQQANFSVTAIREGVLNALVHRDYALAGSGPCKLDITDDAFVIESPGDVFTGNELADLQRLTAGSTFTRNPQLAARLAEPNLREGTGLGMKTFRQLGVAGYPLPSYSLDGRVLKLTIYRNLASAGRDLAEARRSTDGVNGNEKVRQSRSFKRGAEFLATRDVVSRKDYADAVEVSIPTAFRHLQIHEADGTIEIDSGVGGGRSTRYRVRHGAPLARHEEQPTGEAR